MKFTDDNQSVDRVTARTKLAFVTLIGFCISGCITELNGRPPPKENPVDAAEVNVQLGVGYLRQGDFQSAMTKLEKAVQQDPKNVVAHSALGIVYQNMGDMEGAGNSFRRAVSIAPNDPDALNGLAGFLCRNESGRTEALKLFDKALSVPPSKVFSNKAMLNSNAGTCAKPLDLERAERYLRAALAWDPTFPDALLQMADVALRRENALQSRAFLARHLAVTAPTAESLWLGYRIEQAMGDFRAADDFGMRLRVDFPDSVQTRQLLERLRDVG